MTNDKFKRLVKNIMIINSLSHMTTHVGHDLIILCAGDPYVDDDGIVHNKNEIIDKKNGLFNGSKLRWEASAKELLNPLYDRFLLVGGSVTLDNHSYSKAEAMKIIIMGYLNLSTDEMNKISDKMYLLTSEPNTLGNCTEVKKFYDKTHYPKTIHILTNSWHMDRSILIFDNYFKDKYVNYIEPDCAESVLNFSDEECAEDLHMTLNEYNNLVNQRTLLETKGIKQIIDGSYKSI